MCDKTSKGWKCVEKTVFRGNLIIVYNKIMINRKIEWIWVEIHQLPPSGTAHSPYLPSQVSSNTTPWLTSLCISTVHAKVYGIFKKHRKGVDIVTNCWNWCWKGKPLLHWATSDIILTNLDYFKDNCHGLLPRHSNFTA